MVFTVLVEGTGLLFSVSVDADQDVLVGYTWKPPVDAAVLVTRTVIVAETTFLPSGSDAVGNFTRVRSAVRVALRYGSLLWVLAGCRVVTQLACDAASVAVSEPAVRADAVTGTATAAMSAAATPAAMPAMRRRARRLAVGVDVGVRGTERCLPGCVIDAVQCGGLPPLWGT